MISLVITIILLLILATVAISLAVDNDGLFSKAGDAANKWNSSVAAEGSTLEKLMLMANSVDSVGGTTLPDGWDPNKVVGVVKEEATNRMVPIPKGYVASSVTTEDEISEGLVIYEKTESITEVNAGNHEEALTSCNQFVWIPVDDIDYMVMCKSNNKLPEGEGNKTCDLEVLNGSLQCTNPAHTETKADLCGRVYTATQPSGSPETVDGKSVYTYNMTFTAEERATQVWDTSSYREPDIVSDKDKDDATSGNTYMATAGITSGLVSDFEAQLKSEFRAMAESVEKYGGFYIARYEAGANGASKKNQEVMVAGTNTKYLSGVTAGTYIEEDNMWYGLYYKLRTSTAINKEAVSSHMMWGCQYDMIINFLNENTTNEPFKGHIGRQLVSQIKTGSNLADIMNNVYDFEGNHWEWTAQAYSTNRRSGRGGYFCQIAYSECYPVSVRGQSNTDDSKCTNGTRVSLYL